MINVLLEPKLEPIWVFSVVKKWERKNLSVVMAHYQWVIWQPKKLNRLLSVAKWVKMHFYNRLDFFGFSIFRFKRFENGFSAKKKLPIFSISALISILVVRCSWWSADCSTLNKEGCQFPNGCRLFTDPSGTRAKWPL